MLGYWHPKSSVLHCVLSSFQMMNETVLDALPADQVGIRTGMERRMGIRNGDGHGNGDLMGTWTRMGVMKLWDGNEGRDGDEKRMEMGTKKGWQWG